MKLKEAVAGWCRENIKIFFIIFVLVFAVFGQSIFFEFFIFDDYPLLVENKFVYKMELDKFLWPWKEAKTPIVYNIWQTISYFFTVQNPAPYRVLNLVLHVFNTLLIIVLLKSFREAAFKEEGKFSSSALWLGALYFAFHPVQVESVVWISALKEIAACTSGLLSIITFFESHKRKSVTLQALSFIFLLTGMLTHPTIAALCFFFPWVDFVVFKKKPSEIFYKDGLYIFIIVAAFLVHKTVNPQVVIGTENPWYIRLLVSVDSLRGYFHKVFVPIAYSFDYMMNIENVVDRVRGSTISKVFIFLSVAMVWVIILLRKVKIVFLPLMTFVILITVNLGLVQYTFQNISSVADRYLYFPLIGISFFIACSWEYIRSHRYSKLFVGALGAYLFVMFLMTLTTIPKWKSSVTLLHSSLGEGYISYPLSLSLATSFRKAGDNKSAKLYYEEAFSLSDNDENHDEEEPLALLFSLYAETKNKEDGMALLEKVKASESIPRGRLIKEIGRFLIAVDELFEYEELLNGSKRAYPDSILVKNAAFTLFSVKMKKLLESYYQIAINEFSSGELERSAENFKRFLDLAITLKHDQRDAKIYLDKINKKKNEKK